MKLKVKIFLMLSFLAIGVKAQSTAIGRVDHRISPTMVLSQDSLTDVYASSTNITLQVEFTNISNTSQVYIHLGSFEGGSNGVSITFNVINLNGSYYLESGSYSFEVVNNLTILNLVSGQTDIERFRYAAVWLKDKQSNVSAKSKSQLQ